MFSMGSACICHRHTVGLVVDHVYPTLLRGVLEGDTIVWVVHHAAISNVSSGEINRFILCSVCWGQCTGGEREELMGISEYSTVGEKLHYFDWLLHEVLSISRTEDVLVMVSEVGNLNGPL